MERRTKRYYHPLVALKWRVLTILLAAMLFRCPVSSTADLPFADYYDPPTGTPFLIDTTYIELGAPESGYITTAPNLRLNWDASALQYYLVLISPTPMTQSEGSLTQTENIAASWNSTRAGGSNPGYVDSADLYVFSGGLQTSAPFVFTPGPYYWLVLGYDSAGNLTHSSQQWEFVIVP